MSKTAFLQKNVNNFETVREIFLYLQQINLRALQFYICKFEVNRDLRTRCTNSWSNLTLKCNPNTFVKVDAQIEENCRPSIPYPQARVFLPKASVARNWVIRNLRRIQFAIQEEQLYAECRAGLKTSIHQTYFVFVPLFWKPILTRQNIASTRNSQEFLASQVSVLRRNKATNSSTSNRPFFSCTESPCIRTW